MNKQKSLIIFTIILTLTFCGSCTLSLTSLTARHSNQGYITDYLFQFTPTYSYQWGTTRIDFPIQYILSSFQTTLDCWISNSGLSNDYNKASCHIQPYTSLATYFVVGSVYVDLQDVKGGTPFFVLLRNVVNPINRDMTSFFSVCIEVHGTEIQCDRTFSRMLLTNNSIISNQTASFTSSPVSQVVGQGNSFIFTFPVSSFGSWYSNSELISVRAIFPQQFWTNQPLCSIASHLTSYEMTYVPTVTNTFEARSYAIQCKRIANFTNFLNNGSILSIKIDTIINPLWATSWSGSKFQILRSIHNELIQVISLGTPINVQMQNFIVSKKQTNYFRNATTIYYLYVNHDVILDINSSIQITIGNGSKWDIHSIALLQGFTSPNTVQTKINNGQALSTIQLSNYGTASRKVQQTIAINLTSPINIGYHQVELLAQINTKNVGIWAGSFYINQTYGEFDLLSLSAVRKKVKLPANATGSLQLTFFLNYQLPPSQGLTNGSLQVSIYPQLTQPNPDINGVLKCYFKGNYEASNCTLNNTDPSKTTITIVSPPLEAFQYSQVPILITTEGAINQNFTGFPIDPLVTRYRFQTNFYLYNSSVIPSEVFYTEWIADSIEMNSTTILSLTHECNQWTHVQVNLTMPILNPISLSRELRVRVEFMAHPITKINAWDPSLGYASSTIYKQYPCLVKGLTGTRIKCDLYTYTSSNPTSPYNNLHINSDSTGSFFIIYGFVNTNLTGANVMIQFPKLKIGSIANAPAMVQVSILEETPAMLQPYVSIYFQNITAFTTLSAISIGQTAISTSQSFPVQVQTAQQYNITWNPINPSQIIYIKYEISQPYFPSFSTTFGACTSNNCLSFSLPANWIVQKATLPVGNPYSMQSLWSFITSIPFLSAETQNLPIHITTYDGIGNTIDKIFMNYNYTVQQMVGYFDFLEPIYYAGLAQWYSISFSNAPVTVSSYPFIRLKLDQNLIFSTPIQCNSTTILPFNLSGLLFNQESPQSLVIYNIKQIAPSGTYQFNCRLQASATKYNSTISPTINIQLHHNYSIGNSYTATADNVLLQQAPVFPNKAKPYKFQIDNPQIMNEEPRVNYVGSVFIDFTSATNSSNYLKLVFNNHRYNKAGWTTPNFQNSDPPVCFINKKRYSCSWTNNPLTITISSPSFSIGSNKLELTSEYVAPYNGVKFPGSAGQYSISMMLLDSNSTVLQTHSFFASILPHKLLHFEASSIAKDIGTESVYIVNFTIPTWGTPPNPYNHASNYSRIFIQFPTKVDGDQLFSSNLGGYVGNTNERVGCSFTLGSPYIAAIPTQQLQCVLIPPEFSGANVKVQIINHNGLTTLLNSVSLYIFKVFNPTLAYRSFDLRVTINQYEVGTGYVYPIFVDKYTIFLDPYTSNANPIKTLTVDNQTIVNFFDPTLNVGNYGPITLTAQSLTGNTLADPYYVIFKLPPYLPPENNQVTPPFQLCPVGLFQFCITSPQINYVMVKAKSSPSSLKVFIRSYPASISQTDSLFQASVIQQGRYTGQIIYNITNYRWQQIQGSITFNSVTVSGSSLKLDLNKQYAEILVSFTTQSKIPASGTIQIVFPPSITKIYPNCRSATGVGSALYSASGVGALGPSGEVGCAIQSTNHWVITSFQAISNATLIIIQGYIDLPSVSGTIGVGQIITYADTNQNNIYTNGSRIDYVQTDFLLTVSTTQAMNVNQNIFLSQRSVLRQNYIGQFRYLFALNYTLNVLDYIELSLYKNDIKANTGGFAINNRTIVCQFIRIDTEERIGCFVDLATQTNIYLHEVLMYHLRPVQNLLSSITYEARLTSQDYNIPEGINYPTAPGTFKIDFLTNHTTVGVVQIQQRYIQVVGVSFSKLIVTQFNFQAGFYSPFWIELSPTTTIATTHQIILQFPTISNDGITHLFLDDLGWSSIRNGEGIPIDMFDCAYINTFMNCRLFYGSYLNGRPAKIICGNLQSSLSIGQTLKFAFAMTNPTPMTITTLSQIAIPIFVYSYDPQLYQKINYNTVNVGAIINNANNTAVPTGYFSTINNQLQTPNQQLRFSRYNTKAFTIGDFYVVKFNFPIRVNTKVVSGCRDNFGTIIGTAFYHQNLRTVVCSLSSALATNPMPTLANLVLFGFFTPWYLLTAPERSVTAIASYQLITQSQYIMYFDQFPLLNPRSMGFSPAPYFTLSPLLAHNIACQQNDYIFTMRLQNNPSLNFNLQYTKMVLITMPSQGLSDFNAVNTDCMQHYTSTIEIISCQIDPTSRTIQIVIVPGVYQNGNTLAIVTRGLAITNPCSTFTVSSWNAMQWSVYYLSFENGTAMTPSTSYAYITIDSLNMQFTTLSLNYQHSVSLFYQYPPFSWFQIPYQRYYNEFLQYDVNQYSPFAFQFQVATAIPAVTYNKLTVQFGSNYLPCGSQFYMDDLSIFTPICYLHNTRVQRCYVNMTSNTTYMQFNFSLPANTNIHAYFSVVDPRNPQMNGYSYIGQEDVNQLLIRLQSSANTYLFQTPPFAAAETQFGTVGALPVRGITYGSISYANGDSGQLNVLDMTFTVSRSDITALKFQIPLVDANGNQIFGASYQNSFFNLQNGDEYPCGNNQVGIAQTSNHKCYLFYGGFNLIGSPVQIIMTDINQGTQIKARLMMINPTLTGGWISVNVMAYTGTQNQISLYGGNVAGYWSFSNVFQVLNYGVSSSVMNGQDCCWTYFKVNKYIWRDFTTWTLYPSYATVGDYVILELLLYQYNNGSPDDEICKVNFSFGDANSDDVIYLKSKESRYEKAYFIKKWTGANWNIQYFKCKHYINSFRVWYSNSQTSVYIVDFRLSGWYSYYPAVGYQSSLNYFYIFPLHTKTYIQFDVTPQITSILAQGFTWDTNVQYFLQIQYYGFYPTVQKCIPVQGLVSSYMKMPVSCVSTGMGFKVTRFTQILKNPRIGRYRVKLQIQHNPFSQSNGYPTYSSLSVNMYAHLSGSNGFYNDWYIFSATGSPPNLFQALTPIGTSCLGCPSPPATNIYYSHYPTSAMDPAMNLINVGMNAAQTTLQLHFTLTPVTTITMNTGYTYSFPRFRVVVNNFPFFCAGFVRYIVTMHRFGFSYPLDITLDPGVLTCPRVSEIQINFFYYSTLFTAKWGNIWGVEGATTWTTDAVIEFDIEVMVSGIIEPTFYRQWISVHTFVDMHEFDAPTSSCCWCLTYINCYIWTYLTTWRTFPTTYATRAFSEAIWQPNSPLFSSIALQPLTNNINQPTQMSIVFSSTQFAFGPASYGKLLLVQLSPSINPFTYLNSSSTLVNRIQCKCITDNLPGVTLDQTCYFRGVGLTSLNTAITIDIQLTLWKSATCYFPEWKIQAGSLSATAKLTNDYGGFPSYYTTYTTYGGFYQTSSLSLSFVNAAALPSATLTQTSTPSIYSPTSQVNTFQVDYALAITVPQATTQAIVYIDFQKGGIIPILSLCTNTYFLFCRIYKTLRHIMIAQFKLPTAAGGTLLLDSNFVFNTYLPTHWQYGIDSDYALIARVIQTSTDNFYSFKGTFPRTALNLIPTPINVTVNPQRTTGTLLSGFTTNLILSFTIGNQSLYSYYTNNNAHIDITCSNAATFITNRGCTVLSVTNPMFKFYCQIFGSTLTIQNRYFGTAFTSTGLIQVIVGITNPAAPITFTLTGYEYYFSATNYGISFTGSATYSPTVYTGVNVMQANQLKMYPFYTKIYSATSAPLRLGFKLSAAIGTITFPTYYFVITNLNVIGGFTQFQCLIRSFSTLPTSNQQTIFPNSYRNYKQRTQHENMFVTCSLIAAGLQITIPGPGLQSNIFYELVVTPAGTTQSGFINIADTLFSVIVHPASSERIDQIYQYSPGSFTLTSMQIVTKRPQSATALLLEFNINFNSALTYPKHYIQIVFRDLDITSIKPAYSTPGSNVPCTLSSLFLPLASRTQAPLCTVQKMDLTVGTIVIKATQIGSIVAGAYILTFDDFLLPDLVNPPLEDSSPFTFCLRFHDFVNNFHYQNCFDEIFVIDYSTYATAQLEDTGTMQISNNTYGSTGVIGNMTISSYPLTSTGLGSQKIMMRINDGYAKTTTAPIALQGYTLLWYNKLVNLYIFSQNNINAATSVTLNLNNLLNPQVHQMSLYTSGSPSIELTFYNKYHPIQHYVYSQPTFSSFVLEETQIYTTSILYTDDVKQSIPFNSMFIVKMEIVILDSPAVIIAKEINHIVISFDSNVSKLEQCWIDTGTVGQSFQKDGQCTIVSSNSILLEKIPSSFNSKNLPIYIKLRLSGSLVTYSTTVYCKNNQIQYYSNSSQLFSNINSSLFTYPLLDFTQNTYTSSYYQLSTQLNRANPAKYLYFVLQLPADLTQGLTVFTITLQASILPSNSTFDKRMVCEWLTTDRHLRKYNTGVQSVCSFSTPTSIVVQAPFGGLPRLSSNNTPITYMLKIRQFFLVNSLFTMPTVSNSIQIVFTHQNGAALLQDTLIVYPYATFQSGKLSVNTFTLTAGELNTYDITFTPQSTISIGKEAILQLSIDSRYMPNYLGLKSLYQQYGVDTTNTSWINNAGFNVGYTYLPTNWVNGLPYTGYTSTHANAQQTCFYLDSKTFRLALLFENQYLAGTTYNWKIPLLMNPTSPNMTFRMNLTLLTYWTGTARKQKQLFYEIINPFLTTPNNSALLNYTFNSTALSNTVQSSAATINIDFAYPFVPDTTSIVELKISNRGVAIIGLNNFYNYIYNDATYNFYFFRRINLVIGLKNANNSSPTINFGTLEQTNNFVDYFGYDWVKVHSNVNHQTIYNAGSLFEPLLPCSVLTVTPNILEGISSQSGSQFLQQFVFATPCGIQKNSIMSISFNNSLLSWSKETPCYTSFRSASCTYMLNGSLSINFNQNIAVGATVTISVYLQSLQPTNTTEFNITGYIYALPQNTATVINTIPLLNTLPDVLASNIYDGNMENVIILPLYENTYMPLLGRLIPHYLSLTFIQITRPFTWTPNSHHRFLYRLNGSLLVNNSGSLAWMQANQTVSLANLQKFVIQPSGLLDYNLYSNLQYTFLMSSTYDSAKLNNFSIGSVGSYYNFIYQSDQEIEYQEVYPVPVADALTLLVPISVVNQPTAVGVRFKMLTHSIKPGDMIEIYLDSHNLIKGMYQFTTTPIQCAQGIKGILTASPNLICSVWQYPQNKQPLIIRVHPTINVAANTLIEIWISPLINPASVMVAGVIVKITIDCLGQQRCQIYEARGYYSTKDTAIIDYNTTVATFTPSNLQALKTGITHTYTFSTQAVTAAILDYPENYDNVMTQSCTYALGKCIVFPKQKRVVVIPTVPASISSLQLFTMNNGMHVLPISKYVNMFISSASSLQFYNVVHPKLTTIKTNYVKGVANSMTIVPTQSPNLFLRNYMNTATITMNGLFTDPYITAFYIHAPSDIVTWDTTYCNATLGTGGNNPYPTRLSCGFINDTTLSIMVPQGVSYIAGVTDGQPISLNCKFYIKDFSAGQDILYVSTPIVSQSFNAYGSYSQNGDDYHYYITEVAQTITISQYQIPPIGKIDFTTESYMQRFANINDAVYFDLLFDPATTDQISTIQIKLPKEFGYPPVGNHDACFMVSRTTVPLQNCQQIRRDDDTYILITPPATYNNGPVIITIANQNYSNWFTAPSVPGSWYNYTVSAYGVNGTLLERQHSENCSTIGGLELYVPNMTIKNGLDAMMEEIVDVSFVVGSVALYQGYPDGLQVGSYYTAIKITFENWGAFSNLLNIQNTNQSLIGCVTQGLTFKQEIQCQLIGGTDIEHQPEIIISGFERVPAFTNISISIPNILMLNTNIRNVLWVSVVLHKKGSWQQSYLYNPEGLVLKKTSNLAVVPLNSLDIGYVGINRIGSNNAIYLAVNPSVDITTYFIIKLPSGFINANYSLFNYSCDNGRAQIFYRSNLIRIYPNGGVHLSGNLINYTISNFPSTSYVIASSIYPIFFEAYNNFKQIHRQTFNMMFQSYPCSIVFGLITLSSPYVFDTNVSYVFEVNVPDITVYPDQTTISLTIPQQFPSLFTYGVKCTVAAPLQCSILTDRIALIRQIEQVNSSKILVEIAGLTNPSTINHTFTVQTYDGDNVNQVKCQSSISVALKKSDQQSCLFAAHVSLSTINTKAKYTFTIVCNQVLRNNSDIKISLSKDYLNSNNIAPLSCWSHNPFNLVEGNCYLLYENATLYVVFQKIIVEKNQVSLGLSAIFNNTIYPKSYQYQAFISLYGQVYSVTKTQTLNFTSNVVNKILSINLYNLPCAGGSQSIYLLKIPSKFISNTIQIDFPPYFSIDSSIVTSIYLSNNTNWFQSLSYFDLLQYSYQSQVTSAVYPINSGGSTISAGNIPASNGTWFYLILKFIVNPSYYDTTYSFVVRSINSYKQLLYIYEGPLNIQINIPSSSIHMIGLTTGDSDLTMLTVHNVTYRVDQPIFTNLTSFVITPPKPSNLYAIDALQCCLILNYSQVVECGACRVGVQEIQYKIASQGLLLLPDQVFTIQLTSLFTPQTSNQCQNLADYLKAYYKLLVFRNGTTLTHESIAPSADEFTPCQTFAPLRGDILFNPPSTIYAGLAYQLSVGITRPSKMLRVFLSSPDFDLTFTPNGSYFNSYDIATLPVYLLVNPNARATKTSIKITHNQSIVYNIFRDNLPVTVVVRTDPKQYIQVMQAEYFTVGNYINIPVAITHIASYDMYLSFTVKDTTSKLFQFQTNPILIPALTKQTYFRFRYNGTIVPDTLNVSLVLQSSSLIKHLLQPSKLYFFFSTTEEFQTLPPVMKLNIMHKYINNSHFSTKKIYNVNSSPILYDQLLPYIIKHEDVYIGSTKASIRIFTRHQAEVYYVLLERGNNYTSPTPTNIRTNISAKMSLTARNSSHYVNAYTIINFTHLEHQTMYSVYAMAHDSLGDSKQYVIHNFMTKALPNAVQLRIDTLTVITDVVYLVHAISQILNIDILRVKIVDSYIIKNNTWTKNKAYKNQLYYRNLVVVSPSLIDDSPTPLKLVNSALINNKDNRIKLKQILPQFIDNFEQRKASANSDELPLIELIINLPKIKSIPNVTSVSYYNISLTYKLWSKATIYSVAIQRCHVQTISLFNASNTKYIYGSNFGVLTDDIPYSKQIIFGKNSYNANISAFVVTPTDKEGNGVVHLSSLKPGTKYDIYLAFSTPQLYQPILYAQTPNIMTFSVVTLQNPNIKGKDEAYVLHQLKSIDPQMYEIIMAHKSLEESRKNLK